MLFRSDAPPGASAAAAPPGTGGGDGERDSDSASSAVERGHGPAMVDFRRVTASTASTATAAAPGTASPPVAAQADTAGATTVARARRPVAVRVTGPAGREDPAIHRRGRRSLGRG